MPSIRVGGTLTPKEQLRTTYPYNFKKNDHINSTHMVIPQDELRQIFPAGFQHPVLGVITQRFGQSKIDYGQFGMKGHNGLDYSCPTGTPIVAPFDGVVEAYFQDNGYGNNIRLRSKPITIGGATYKLEAVFAHLKEPLVSTGVPVQQGQPIALSNNTGFSTGPHLHFGVRFVKQVGTAWVVQEADNGYSGYFDPLPLLNLRLSLAPYEGKIVYCTPEQVGARHYLVKDGELYWVEDEVAFCLSGFVFSDAVQLPPAAAILVSPKTYVPDMLASHARATMQLLHFLINAPVRAKELYRKYH